MSDPRNVAHDKKIARNKNHHGSVAGTASEPAVQPGKKAGKKTIAAAPTATAEISPLREIAPDEKSRTGAALELEGSLVVLAQLKEMAFHSKAHQEQLAQILLAVEEKPKGKELAVATGELYSGHAEFHLKLTSLIDSYESECARLQS